jgi:methylglutaconyl-CoA hydratase
MTFTQLIYAIEHRVARITLNRPEKRNALTPTLITELREAFRDAHERADVRVVLLQAAGEAFCAGLDLGELGKLASMNTIENLADTERLAALFREIYTHKKFVISVVQGAAFAGGCGLACAADVVVADKDTATFCYSESKIGFIPAVVAVLILRKTRHAGIREMLLRANAISADDALRLGMINYSVPTSDLHQTAQRLAEDICTHTSAHSIELTKRLLWSAESLNLEDAVNFAVSLNALSRTTDDLKRGIAAFLNKEKIAW